MIESDHQRTFKDLQGPLERIVLIKKGKPIPIEELKQFFNKHGICFSLHKGAGKWCWVKQTSLPTIRGIIENDHPLYTLTIIS